MGTGIGRTCKLPRSGSNSRHSCCEPPSCPTKWPDFIYSCRLLGGGGAVNLTAKHEHGGPGAAFLPASTLEPGRLGGTCSGYDPASLWPSESWMHTSPWHKSFVLQDHQRPGAILEPPSLAESSLSLSLETEETGSRYWPQASTETNLVWKGHMIADTENNSAGSSATAYDDQIPVQLWNYLCWVELLID